MANLTLETISSKLTEFFQSKEEFKLIGIFGSYAKNKSNANSDIDICVAADRPLSSEAEDSNFNDLSLLLKKEIDLVDILTANGVLLKEMLHSAVWVRKNPNDFAKTLTRMLFDQADFQPYYQKMLQKKRERFLKK